MKFSETTRQHLKRMMATAVAVGSISAAQATPQLAPEGGEEIAEYVQMDLRADQQLAGADIAISVSNHLAVLTGEARSLAQAERATSRAIASHGIDGVVNRITIRSAQEGRIKASAADLLKRQKMLDASGIQISANGSRLTLDGTVGTLDERELARALMSEVPGVTAIRNNLVVTFEGIRTDAQIAEQLRFKIRRDPLYQGLDLTVAVKDGVARLNGQVGSRGEHDRLIRQSYVTGVMEVNANGLEVNSDLAMEAVGDKNYTTEQSLLALRTILAADPRIEPGKVKPEVHEGVITLRGEVESWTASDAAELAAHGIPGVIAVANELTVLPRIQGDIRAASPPLLKPER